MHDVDGALIIRLALTKTREVTEITTGRENGSDAGYLCNSVGILQPFKRFDHQNQHDIVIDRVSVAARNVSPHGCVEGLPATVAASSKGRKVSPVSRLYRFFDGVHCRHDHDKRAGVEGVLYLSLVGVGNTHAGHSLRVGAGSPHPSHFAPAP